MQFYGQNIHESALNSYNFTGEKILKICVWQHAFYNLMDKHSWSTHNACFLQFYEKEYSWKYVYHYMLLTISRRKYSWKYVYNKNACFLQYNFGGVIFMKIRVWLHLSCNFMEKTFMKIRVWQHIILIISWRKYSRKCVYCIMLRTISRGKKFIEIHVLQHAS